MIQPLLSQVLGPLGPTNFLKYLIRLLLEKGAALETIYLLLALPLVATLVAAARYLIGIRGLGIYTPVLLAAGLFALGVTSGFKVLLLILLVSTLVRLLLRQTRMHYLARMALIFWFVCLTALFTLFWLPMAALPLLLLLLLSETFVQVQIGKSFQIAFQRTLETFILAFFGWFWLSWPFLQRLILLQPELVALAAILFNLFVGRFTGLRLLEYQRFKRLLKQ